MVATCCLLVFSISHTHFECACSCQEQIHAELPLLTAQHPRPLQRCCRPQRHAPQTDACEVLRELRPRLRVTHAAAFARAGLFARARVKK